MTLSRAVIRDLNAALGFAVESVATTCLLDLRR
jgi:hypothetical protein